MSYIYSDGHGINPNQGFKVGPLTIHILPEILAVCRLPAEAPTPEWAISNELLAITRTSDELSIVCAEGQVPDHVMTERGWRAFKVAGPLDFSLVGVLASLAASLAEVNVSIFALSTYNTDYILVKANDLERASQALKLAGHKVQSGPGHG